MVAAMDTERHLVVFSLGSSAYGVDIQTVREIREPQRVTPYPGVPDYVEGIINLRGQVLPVFNLARRLGLNPADQHQPRMILVVECRGSLIGCMVDAVNEVLRVPADQVEQQVEFLGLQSGAVTGIARLGDQLVVILDLDVIMPAVSE